MTVDDYVKIILSTSVSFAILIISLQLAIFIYRLSNLFGIIKSAAQKLDYLFDNLSNAFQLLGFLKDPTTIFKSKKKKK